ncbi:hypothetical protein EVAR_57328_1 [Eumeta japonica]|uniref:Nucleic-acid-binding protein from transposon X-element n=1 Tax=Eumeta variegata TaxID=151549 RepID=A0A4C1ZWJ4_EUMVA|nr:hypothetical protein EVAR_57328_1 [Eumeta japonica]
MSRRVTETMPRRDEVPPPSKGAQRRVAATLTFPLEAGEGSIEMPRQTETPEGASVAPVGGFAKRVSPCQPSPSAFTSTRPPIQSPASSASLRSPLASKSLAPTTFWRWNGRRPRGLATLRRLRNDCKKTTEHHLDRCLRVETAVANMAAEIKRTQDAIDRMDIPNKLEGLRKTLEIKPTTYAAAAAKPKLQAAAKPQVPGPKIAAAHTLIVSSRCANHTSDQVVKAIREVVDAREMGVGVDRVRKARNQKVVLTCVSDDAIKRIETRIKTKSKDLQVSKPEPSLPLIIIRDVLKVNSDAQIVESLKRQNGHTTEGLDWGKVEARVRYRRRARNPLECHPVLERRPVWDQSPLVQCSRCLGFGHSKKWCREQNDKCAHCGGDHTGPTCPDRKAAQPPKCINCTRAGCEDVAHSALSQECGVRAKWDAIARTKVAYC